MASLRGEIPQHNQSQFQSPAKIFAKLKSKVQKEAARARKNHGSVGDKHGADFNRKENFCPAASVRENTRTRAQRSEVQSLTLSPVSTPQKNYPDFGGVDETSLVSEHGFMARHLHTPVRKQYINSTAVFQPPPNKERPLAPVFFEWTPSKRGGVYVEDELMSPSKMILPRLEVSLTKSKLEQHQTYRVHDSGTLFGIQAQDRTFTSKTPREDVRDVFGFQRGVNHAPVFTPRRPTPVKRCVALDNGPLMSPAKKFAMMKEREARRELQAHHEVEGSTRKLFNEDDHFNQKRDSNPQTLCDPDETEYTANGSLPDSVFPDSVCPDRHSREESADSQSNPLEDPPIPVSLPLPVLLEDPLVLNSPKINMPKKTTTVPKSKKLQQNAFPDEGDIYLKKWFLRKNKHGLYLDGIHLKDNVPWNSNIIADRVSNFVVKTISGKVYVLVGKMSTSTDFPTWFSKKFVNGFPLNWKSLYEKFLTEEPVKTSKGHSTLTTTRSEAPAKRPVKPTKQNTFKTPESCPPAPISSSCPKTSRSGRLIKPPLEYWRGGRVTVDSEMNVTIHERYDTSVSFLEVSPPAPAKKPQEPLLLCSEGPSETACSEAESVPVRKVKAPLRKRNQSAPPVDTASSPEETLRRRTRSQSRSPPLKKTLDSDTVPQKQKETEKATKAKSKKQTREANASSIKRTNQRKVPDGKSGPKSGDHSQAGARNQSSRSSGSSEEQKRKGTNATQSQRTEAPPSTKTTSKPSHSTRTHKSSKGTAVAPKVEDEDEWTEAELMKLQEAVSHYPKHTWDYWRKVADMVGSHSAEECHYQHTSQGASQSPAKKPKKPRKDKKEMAKDPESYNFSVSPSTLLYDGEDEELKGFIKQTKNVVTDCPIVSARVGTLRRKHQVRQLLQALPTEDMDDVFSSAGMQKKRFQMSSFCPNEAHEDHDVQMSNLEPLTPMSRVYPELKTPECLHISPGMMGSPDMDNDDKYIYHLQKRMKRNRFNVCKQPQLSKKFTPSPSVKRAMKRCGNIESDTFVVREMFPSDSEEEQDFYFSDT